MMNQGASTDAITPQDPNLLEKHQVVDASQGHTSSYYTPSTGSEAVSWTMHRVDNYSTANGILSNSSHHHDQRAEPASRNVQDGLSVASTSSTGAANAPQEYNNSYTTYQNTDPYGYSSTGYAGYYNGYQQQSNQTYPVETYQSTGATYQPISSFQNTGSYVGPTSYSSTYYNPGDYQTSGGYTGGGYGNQANYANYASHQYPNYTQDANGGYSSSTSTTDSVKYQQDYSKQWADYYNRTEVSCAPGTENISVTSTSNLSCPVPVVTSGYSASFNQPTTPYSTTWRPESRSSEMPSVQPGAVVSSAHDNYWEHVGFQNQNACPQQPQFQKPLDLNSTYENFQQPQFQKPLDSNSTYGNFQQPQFQKPLDSNSTCGNFQQSQFQKPLDSNSTYENFQQPQFQKPVDPNSVYENFQQPQFQKPMDSNSTYQNFQDQQKTAYSQGPNTQYSVTHQVAQSYQPSLQTGSPLDSGRVSKLQIPPNPRIAPNLALALPKTDKDSSTTSAAVIPAYISVSLPKSNDKGSSNDATDSILKPGMFPKSLRGYVERALARCKEDTQMAACQTVMKEIITKATADGTLYTRDWDTEPLFPLPNADVTRKDNLQSPNPVSSLSKNRRSPSRRAKSRWEPIPEEKSTDKPVPATLDAVKYGGWLHLVESNKKLSGGKSENKDGASSSVKFSLSEQKINHKNYLRPVKKQRLGDVMDAADRGEASSDSDKEQSLTAYYSGAITLANSPEEKKRRENRSKRFEKKHGNRADKNHFRPKNNGAGNLYTRRASALVLSKSYEDGGSRAVEDIDWDALTVKGTCQEIEKRYLRLTSAPDAATVRPEEVLEKALLMVQNSQKTYLYKCDQLKSIRQDLTVQRIRNELTVKVYETHARFAIEVGDLPEYNQCQSQLKTLYAEGIKGCHMEFSAYNLLCVILHSNNNRDLLSAMSRLSVETRKDEAVKHALAVRAAVTSGNYVLFFRLYKTAPYLNTFLMDLYVEKMRFRAVRCMCRSYRPTVPVPYVAQMLGFISVSSETSDEKDTDGLEECVEWLKAHGACLCADNNGEMQIDTKTSASNLFMPEPEDAVAHGDANLALNDFFTRTAL